MVKRKASVSSSEDESSRNSKKPKTNFNQSLINAANLMSKSQLLHKGLSLNSSLLNRTQDSSDDDDNKVKSKVLKRKKKVDTDKSNSSPQSDDDTKNSQITPKKDTPRKENCNAVEGPSNTNKKSPKRSKSNANDEKYSNSSIDAFTPIKVPKTETNQNSSVNAFTPIKVPKTETNQSNEINKVRLKKRKSKASSSDSNSESDNDKNERMSLENSGNLPSSSKNSFNAEPSDDTKMMDLIEDNVRKVRIIQDIKIGPQKDPKQHLKEMYPNLKQQNLKTKLKVNDSDEIFMFRIPKNIDPQNLLNVNIDVENGGRIKIGEKYVIRLTSKIPHPALVIGKNNKILNFKRNIVMEKYIKEHKEAKIPVAENISVPLPNDLKNRHPLFGPNFEEKITLDETVEKKLDDAIKNLLKQQKKISKKKIQKDEEKEENEIVFDLLKNANTSEMHNDSASTSHNKSTNKKKMTKNDLIQETLRIMKQELHTEYETDSGVSSHKKKKQKKSKKIDDNEDNTQNSPNISIKQEPLEDNNILTKREKRRMSLANSTMLTDTPRTPKFNPEISSISHDPSEKKVSKRDKKKNVSLHETVDPESLHTEASPKVSKKRKIEEEHDEISSPMKKKKKKNAEID